MAKKKQILPEASDVDYLTAAQSAVIEQTPQSAQLLIWLIFLFFIVMGVWAGHAAIDEVTRGEGKVIPAQQIQVVQNLEGGILSEILVREGQVVEKGDILLQIDDTRFSSSLKESQIKYDALRAKVARLTAEVYAESFQLDDEVSVRISKQVQQEKQLLASHQQALQNQIEIFQQQLLQRKQELIELESKKKQLSKGRALLAKELKMTRPLVASGAISEVEVLRLERDLTDLNTEIDAAAKAIPRIKSTLSEARKKIKEVEFSFRNKARAELNEASAELSTMNESEKALQDRVKRTAVRSPVKGTIKQLKVATVGGVIQPGMDLLEIVPLDDTLLIEAKIRPSDIGFIHPQQVAVVKFTAYDFAVYGGLEGIVEQISADTILDEDEESFYRVRVRTNQSYIEKDQKQLPIIPGMQAGVDILTGKKTVLDYLLKPILKAKQTALRER
jgi:membrane fusion protein, adhesin transport system